MRTKSSTEGVKVNAPVHAVKHWCCVLGLDVTENLEYNTYDKCPFQIHYSVCSLTSDIMLVVTKNNKQNSVFLQWFVFIKLIKMFIKIHEHVNTPCIIADVFTDMRSLASRWNDAECCIPERQTCFCVKVRAICGGWEFAEGLAVGDGLGWLWSCGRFTVTHPGLRHLKGNYFSAVKQCLARKQTVWLLAFLKCSS